MSLKNQISDHPKATSSASTLLSVPPDQKYLQVIEALRSMHKSDKKAAKKVNKLLVLAPWFSLPNVGLYIRRNPDKMQEVLCLAQDRADLTDEQFFGVAFGAIMTGDKAFVKLP